MTEQESSCGFHIEMRNIYKSFGDTLANENVNFSVRKGEVHALLGENGAGKSTLMNILYGLYAPTAGEVFLEGKPVHLSSPEKAIAVGIGMVHQHFMLIPALTVAENMVLGISNVKNPLLNMKKAAKAVEELSAKHNMHIDPLAKVSELTIGQQQRLEILKALYRGAKLLILDEPTAVLTPQEVQELFAMIHGLTEQGTTVIMITHKLHEVMAICDTITVLRQGQSVACIKAADTNKLELAQLMVGKEISTEYPRQVTAADAPVVLTVDDLSYVHNGVQALKDISLQIQAGEVLGLCGVDGNGQRELVEILAGMTAPTTGDVWVNGENVAGKGVRATLAQGVAHIPADRHKHGVVLDMSLTDNILMMNYFRPNFSNKVMLNKAYINQYGQGIIEKYNVKTPSASAQMKTLSGGNQQKVVLGREMERQPKLLLAAHPVRGLDIGATDFVHRKILEARDGGAAVLLVSSELEDIVSISDRIAVIFQGEIVGVVPPQTPVEELGLMMAGVRYEQIERGEIAQ